MKQTALLLGTMCLLNFCAQAQNTKDELQKKNRTERHNGKDQKKTDNQMKTEKHSGTVPDTVYRNSQDKTDWNNNLR